MCREVCVVSVFAGIEGFGLGFERAGMRVVAQIENDPACNRVLREHYPYVPRFGDVREVSAPDLPAADLLCGGFPCQDLSVAGRRAGLAGKRSGLFFEFMRLAAGIRPRWLVIENVPGLLSSNEGRDMGTVLWSLGQLGYWWAYRSLDAQYFGLAQRRERVFIVGCLGNRTAAAKVLFEPESCAGDTAPSREAGAGVAGTLEARAATGGYDPGAHGAATGHLIAHTLTSNYGKQPDNSNRKGGPPNLVVASESGPGWWRDGIGPLRAEGENRPSRPSTLVAAPFALRGREDGQEIEVGAGPAHALRPSPGSSYSSGVFGGFGVRRLTPAECERLQGFPDGWTACLSDSARYRTLGNAVAVPAAEWIGCRILKEEADGRGP